MFDMFNGGKPDLVTLITVEYEKRQEEVQRVINYIKKNYNIGDSIDPDEITNILGINRLTDEEIEYVTEELMY